MTARHGSESFFILGEGLVNTQVGGRSGTAPDPITDPDAAAPAKVAADEAPPFRFSRVGPRGRGLGDRLTAKLAAAMIAGQDSAGGGVGRIPAGYTYLGQFIDHDLTMDATDVTLGEDVRPADLLQGRSPSLDLDSLYGAGPADEVSAKFYEADGLHLKVGDTAPVPPDGVKQGHDLPRVGKGTRPEKRKALIPDPRNDAILILAQTHVAMIHFHNRVVDRMPSGLSPAQKFRKARQQVTLHYHWLIRHDFLPRIAHEKVVADVFDNGRKLVEPDADPTSVPTMPVEFSVAAYRFGHSMPRETYNWNRRFPGTSGFLDYMFEFTAVGGNLGGALRLQSNWIADWRRMYDFPEGGHPDLAAPDDDVNRAMRIDSLITNPLKNLPPGTFGGPRNMEFDDPRRSLAFRNLTRAHMVHLASGQQMVERLAKRGVTVKPLTRNQILKGDGGARLTGLTTAEQDRLVANTPLWFYVLREAETGDGRLRGVGARIVAETFHRAMEGSRFSLLRHADFRPRHGRGDVFEMTDLLFFAFRGKKSELNPLGGK
jgi:hypothetical protein